MSQPNTLHVYAPAGVELRSAALKLARRRLAALGFTVTPGCQRARSPPALCRRRRAPAWPPSTAWPRQRRRWPWPAAAATASADCSTSIDWPLLARAAERGTRWVGHSDITALQLGLLAHTGATSWQGPMACDDFGRSDDAGGTDEVTVGCFTEAMSGELEAVGFRTEAGFDGLDVRGKLWGGNLTMLLSLLGTPHWPKVKGGVLFLEDVNEHPYRVERMLLQLHQAGVLAQQKAVLLGDFSGWRKSPLDRGYTLKTAVAQLRSVCATPILTGLPFGHVPTKLTLPVGARVQLLVQGRDVLVGW